MTNGDKVRQMNNEELLEFLCDFENCACDFCANERDDCGSYCKDGYEEWLESEADK